MMHLTVPIHPSALQPRRLHQGQQPLVFMMALTMGIAPPGVVTANVNVENLAEPAHRILSRILLDKRVLQPDSLAKYAAAFFNMSRSSVSRLTSARKRRSSMASVLSCSRCWADFP